MDVAAQFGLYQEDVETCYLVDEVKADVEDLIEDELLHREDNKEEKKVLRSCSALRLLIEWMAASYIPDRGRGEACRKCD